VTPGREQPSVVLDPGGGADDLAERLAHPIGDTVGAGAGRLLVLSEHLVGEASQDHLVVALLAEDLQQPPVGREPRGLQRAVTDLDGLLDYQRDLDLVLVAILGDLAHLVLGHLRPRDARDVIPSGERRLVDVTVHRGGLV
jgi:hypothetical protein